MINMAVNRRLIIGCFSDLHGAVKFSNKVP